MSAESDTPADAADTGEPGEPAPITERAPALSPGSVARQVPFSPPRLPAWQQPDYGEKVDQRIKELEDVIKRCDKVLQKGARAEARRKRRAVKHIDEDDEKALVERMYYGERQKRQEREEKVQREMEESAPQLARSTPTRLGRSYDLGNQLRSFVETYASRDVVARNYEDAVEKRQARLEEAEQELQQPHRPPKMLDPGGAAEVADRLCGRELAERKRRKAELQQKWNKEPTLCPPLPKPALEESTGRLYEKAMATRKDRLAALEARYSPEPTRRKLTKEQAAASATRLHNSGR
eukprot:TRINITY_DN55594_c0_g1_i1.p1 TRINITY_DN55594_c0_g1~~TRINITY_DN55594_c0_g1_i1.p1  ORF type:complete len:319 (+),score=137.63 TRINITY_DN55594_c0_g1_i1:78-959(+)